MTIFTSNSKKDVYYMQLGEFLIGTDQDFYVYEFLSLATKN